MRCQGCRAPTEVYCGLCWRHMLIYNSPARRARDARALQRLQQEDRIISMTERHPLRVTLRSEGGRSVELIDQCPLNPCLFCHLPAVRTEGKSLLFIFSYSIFPLLLVCALFRTSVISSTLAFSERLRCMVSVFLCQVLSWHPANCMRFRIAFPRTSVLNFNFCTSFGCRSLSPLLYFAADTSVMPNPNTCAWCGVVRRPRCDRCIRRQRAVCPEFGAESAAAEAPAPLDEVLVPYEQRPQLVISVDSYTEHRTVRLLSRRDG